MSISSTLDRLHARAKGNYWLRLFSIFNRLALAAGFFPSGLVKIFGERFASGLSANHPMGHYLEALHQTGFYYTFIGVVQVAAALMLLFPRTVTLGAFLYFPIILNICILTYATRFEGSLFTAPLMVLANLYLLGWNYEKWKYILPFNQEAAFVAARKTEDSGDFGQAQTDVDARGARFRFSIGSLWARFRFFFEQLLKDKFPTLFFAGVLLAVVICTIGIPSLYDVKPRNTFAQCVKQFNNGERIEAGKKFCGCIHQNGEALDKCLREFYDAAEKPSQSRESHIE